MNLNKAQIIGRVAKDPEVKALPSGSSVCSFSMATNRVWKDKEGAKKEETDWHNIVAFGKVADTLAQYVTKGMLLYIDGRMVTRSWDDKDTGKKQYRMEIIVENFQFGPRAGGAGAPEKSEADKQFDEMGGSQEEEINPDDIPF